MLSGAISIGVLVSKQTACWKTAKLKPARITISAGPRTIGSLEGMKELSRVKKMI